MHLLCRAMCDIHLPFRNLILQPEEILCLALKDTTFSLHSNDIADVLYSALVLSFPSCTDSPLRCLCHV